MGSSRAEAWYPLGRSSRPGETIRGSRIETKAKTRTKARTKTKAKTKAKAKMKAKTRG